MKCAFCTRLWRPPKQDLENFNSFSTEEIAVIFMTCCGFDENEQVEVATMPSTMSAAKRARGFGSLHADFPFCGEEKAHGDKVPTAGNEVQFAHQCLEQRAAAEGWEPLSSARRRRSKRWHFQEILEAMSLTVSSYLDLRK